MHNASSKKEFNDLAALFLKRWEKKEPEFIKYFEKQWLGSHKNWFAAASVYDPAHNNNIEGYNGVIKRTITFRERLPLSEFVNVMMDMTKGISTDYAKNVRVFADVPEIDVASWRRAAEWSDNKHLKTIARSDTDEKTLFYVPSKKILQTEKTFTMHEVKVLKKFVWRSFDQYVSQGYGFYYSVAISKTHFFTKSQCSCPWFLKHYTCKHVLGLGLRMNLCSIPRAAITTFLGTKKKRGRKAKAVKALLVQSEW